MPTMPAVFSAEPTGVACEVLYRLRQPWLRRGGAQGVRRRTSRRGRTRWENDGNRGCKGVK